MSFAKQFKKKVRVPLFEECIMPFDGPTAGIFDGTGLGIAGTRYEDWELCNGNNGTENLEDAFVVCSEGTYNIGDTDLNPVHNPSGSGSTGTGSGNTDPAGDHDGDLHLPWNTMRGNLPTIQHVISLPNNGSHVHSIGSHTHTMGGVDNSTGLAPYYSLAYIQKIN